MSIKIEGNAPIRSKLLVFQELGRVHESRYSGFLHPYTAEKYISQYARDDTAKIMASEEYQAKVEAAYTEARDALDNYVWYKQRKIKMSLDEILKIVEHRFGVIDGQVRGFYEVGDIVGRYNIDHRIMKAVSVFGVLLTPAWEKQLATPVGQLDHYDLWAD